jgi:hypothetical protein
MALQPSIGMECFSRDERAVAAVDFSIAAVMAIVGILNAVDAG